MEPFRKITSAVAPLPRVNVDTDQIIPKQFLKRIERTGFGRFAFFDWRYLPDASILVTGRNFGCGSSREHAPWALREMGFRCIIAPSFADIFYNNCIQNGILPVVLPEEKAEALLRSALARPGYQITVDLEEQAVHDGDFHERFQIDPFVRERLLQGLDDIALTLALEGAITAFESQRPRWLEFPGE